MADAKDFPYYGVGYYPDAVFEMPKYFRHSLIKPVIIVGAGWHGRSIAWMLRLRGEPIGGFLDDSAHPKMVDDIPVIGDRSMLFDEAFVQRHRFIPAIGDCSARWLIMERLMKVAAELTSVEHPNAINAARRVMQGTVIFPGAILGVGVVVGLGCIVNNGVILGHDVEMKNGSSVCDGSQLAGSVVLGERAFVGIGAKIIPHIKIGEGAIVGAGAVVIKDVPPHTTVVGSPARIVRQDPQRKAPKSLEGAVDV